ncbi:MAG TPA: NADP-dependent oxidoreductase [Alphaproteobacteria bacterium]|nr:NADP-dependent oxidoreductase [Alphaproteobacteria bacterium]
MSEQTNTQILVREIPTGALTPAHFEVAQAPMPALGEGRVLVRHILLSLDAANRAWMQGETYRKAVVAGQVMDGFGVGEVVASEDDGFAPGDIVGGAFGWQQYAALSARALIKLPKGYRPLSHFHSVLGIAGRTAYHGLIWIGEPKEGDTVVVSAAAGSVGQYVGQIAKLKGCRTIGIAGGPEKCAFLTGDLGFDGAIDYKAEHVRKRLAELAPDGIDIYFDNVGGDILEAALFNMAQFGRVVCCGAISQYDTTEMTSPRGIPGVIVFKRLKMQGFIVMDFADKDAEASRDLMTWTAGGKLKIVEDVLEGLERAPEGLIGLLHGDNLGKRMVRIGPDPD